MEGFSGMSESPATLNPGQDSSLPGAINSQRDPLADLLKQDSSFQQLNSNDSIESLDLDTAVWNENPEGLAQTDQLVNALFQLDATTQKSDASSSSSDDMTSTGVNSVDASKSLDPASSASTLDDITSNGSTKKSSKLGSLSQLAANSVNAEISTQGEALLVGNSPNGNSADLAIKTRLETLGYQVTVKDDDAIKSNDANGQDLVVISESVKSNKIGSKFTKADVPVITMEPYVFDDMKMTGSKAGSDYGFKSGQTQVAIETTGHPLAGGLNSSPKVYNGSGSMGWGKPGTGATEIANVAGDSQKSAVFGYDKGATLADSSKAAERRVGMFVMNQNSEGSRLTNEGWQLFDSAVEWATSDSGNSTPSSSADPDPSPAPTPDPSPAPTPDPSPAPTPDPSPAPTPDPGPTPSPTPKQNAKTVRLEAEGLSLSNFTTESKGVASGDRLIKLSGNQGTASSTFEGASGKYDVVVRYFDESDGQSPISLKVGNDSESWTLNQQLGSSIAASKNAVERKVFSNIDVKQGDSIELTGKRNGEEYARVDYIEFRPTGSNSPDPSP
ncbi:MAG: hypothetical protein ACFE0J_09795, partial [Elainellaceae cyanobacterium]